MMEKKSPLINKSGMYLIKGILLILALPITYALISFMLTAITVNGHRQEATNQHIFLSTNGIHLDIILPLELLSPSLHEGLALRSDTRYVGFGWGDENFYLNTPTWDDLTARNAALALLWPSSTLIHMSRYRSSYSSWTKVPVSAEQLQHLNAYLAAGFQLDEEGAKQLLPGKGYDSYDEFYRAAGSYSCLQTCNSWVNTGFRESGLKACLWTPFDGGLLEKYDEE